MAEVPAGVVGTQLEPFLLGLREHHFQTEVHTFLSQHAAEFVVGHTDESHPLAWTVYHNKYKEMFDRQLSSVACDEGFSREDLREYCGDLRLAASKLQPDEILPGCTNVCVADFNEFLRILTASEDYFEFLRVMFDTVIALQQSGLPHQSPAAGEPATTQEIDVSVPEGVLPGQIFAVEFLGCRYELVVPEGCAPGTIFRTAVLLPSTSPG